MARSRFVLHAILILGWVAVASKTAGGAAKQEFRGRVPGTLYLSLNSRDAILDSALTCVGGGCFAGVVSSRDAATEDIALRDAKRLWECRMLMRLFKVLGCRGHFALRQSGVSFLLRSSRQPPHSETSPYRAIRRDQCSSVSIPSTRAGRSGQAVVSW